MKKSFEYIHTKSVVIELVLLAGALFLLIASIVTMIFKLILPGTLYPTIIVVGSFVAISLYLLPKVKPDENVKHFIEIDTDKKMMSVKGRNIENPEIINILRYGEEKDSRYVIKFGGGESVDSRSWKDSKRLLTLLPKVFPSAAIKIFQTSSMVKTIVFTALLASLIMFIISVVI